MSNESARTQGCTQGFSMLQQMEVLALGDPSTLYRPCVDCGMHTGCFCENCFAEHRDPGGGYAEGQHTPLCTSCNRDWDMFHFCRGQQWAVPPPHGFFYRSDGEAGRPATQGRGGHGGHGSSDGAGWSHFQGTQAGDVDIGIIVME